MRNHTMIRHWKLLALVTFGVGVLLFCGSDGLGDTPETTAPLNGTVSFQTASEPSNKLNVDAGDK